MINTFTWADLSTFDINAAKHFYKQCFGWTYQELDDNYLSCESSVHSAAGLFTMPDKLQEIGMPSFWMSYIQVQDIQQTVRNAELHGAKIEIKPQSAASGGTIALIRDPSGAGFTCYEGDELSTPNSANLIGGVVWNELHISSLAKVKDFYTNVFSWHIKTTNHKNRYEIFTSSNEQKPIAGIQVSSNEIRGDKEYWGVYFLVDSLTDTIKKIEQLGGQIIAEQPLGDRYALLAYDQQGAAFYILET